MEINNCCGACAELSRSKRLSTIRNILGLHLNDMAFLFDVHRQTYWKLEKTNFGLKPIQEERLKQVGIDPFFIITGVGKPFLLSLEKIKKNILNLKR